MRRPGPAMIPAWRRLLALGAAAVMIGGLGVAYHRAAQGGIAVDYIAFVGAGYQVGSDPHRLYDEQAQGDAQVRYLGYRPPAGSNFPVTFINPPFAAEIMRPFAALSLQAGTDLFCALLVVAIVIAAMLVARRLPKAVPRHDRIAFAALAAISAGASYAVLLGQWTPLIALAAVGALLLADRDRPFEAGLLLTVGLIKPQMVWLIVPVALLVRQWRLLAGFAVGGAVLGLVSLAIVGLRVAAAYAGLALSFANSTRAEVSRSVPALIVDSLGRPQSISVVAVALSLIALAGVWVWRRRLAPDAPAVIGVGVLLSIGLGAHTNLQDIAVLVAPAAVFVMSAPRRVVALLVALNVAALLSMTEVTAVLVPLTLAAALVLLVHAAVTEKDDRGAVPAASPARGAVS